MNNAKDLIFIVSKKSRIKAENWFKKHKNRCDHDKNAYLMYSFTLNGLGLISEAKCSCGKILDLTDISKW